MASIRASIASRRLATAARSPARRASRSSTSAAGAPADRRDGHRARRRARRGRCAAWRRRCGASVVAEHARSASRFDGHERIVQRSEPFAVAHERGRGFSRGPWGRGQLGLSGRRLRTQRVAGTFGVAVLRGSRSHEAPCGRCPARPSPRWQSRSAARTRGRGGARQRRRLGLSRCRFERGAGCADTAGADAPARGGEAVTDTGDRDNARVREREVERVGPVALDDHSAGSSTSSRRSTSSLRERTWERTGSAPSAPAARPRLPGTRGRQRQHGAADLAFAELRQRRRGRGLAVDDDRGDRLADGGLERGLPAVFDVDEVEQRAEHAVDAVELRGAGTGAGGVERGGQRVTATIGAGFALLRAAVGGSARLRAPRRRPRRDVCACATAISASVSASAAGVGPLRGLRQLLVEIVPAAARLARAWLPAALCRVVAAADRRGERSGLAAHFRQPARARRGRSSEASSASSSPIRRASIGASFGRGRIRRRPVRWRCGRCRLPAWRQRSGRSRRPARPAPCGGVRWPWCACRWPAATRLRPARPDRRVRRRVSRRARSQTSVTNASSRNSSSRSSRSVSACVGPRVVGRLQSRREWRHLASGEEHAQALELAGDVAVAASRVGLAFERLELAPDFAQQVVEPHEVALGRLQPALGLLAATAKLQHAGRLFDDRAAVLGPGVEHGVELALTDDDVLLAADAGVATATPGCRAGGTALR